MNKFIAALVLFVSLTASAFAATVNTTYHNTLTLLTVTTVDITADTDYIKVYNRSASVDVWYTVDGSTPAASSDGTFVIPAGHNKLLQMPDPYNASIKMYCTLGCPVSVEVASPDP